ncbi:hypothetical protein LXA43DRAFT_882724 [Ganoderma leucocontextum]|nr:hypothetical protein LXA43DRAFT_882724 [Ganoderma leucocontextum]
MQPPSVYWHPQGQAWPQQDRFAPSVLPGIHRGVPPWMQPMVAQQHQQQQLLQPTGDLQVPQPLQQPSMQGYQAQVSMQEYLQPHSVQELVGAVAAQLGYTRNDVDSARAIPRSANNDKVVIDALKQGKAKGLDGLVAIEKLGNVNGYANALWKNYALARSDKIFPQVYPTCTISGVARSGVGNPNSRVSRKRPSSENSTGTDNQADPSYFSDRRLGHDSQTYQPSSPISEREGPPTNVQVRSRRGGPIPEYHAGTLIPPLALSSQPKPPVRDVDEVRDGHRFTDEDKVFFIHFLKWYLRQGRASQIPEREDLYLLLARLTPHHNAEAWKRHWDDAPELPDQIYIEARKRADDEALARSASLSPSSNGDGSEDGIDAADDGPPTESTSPVVSQVQRVPRAPHRPRGGVKVTEEDLREMAQYKYERRDVWDQHPNAKARWEEFAERPQNLKRSLLAWYTVERDNEKLDRYYKEYAAAATAGASDEKSDLGAESELEYVDVTTPPQHNPGRTSVSASSGSDTQVVDGVLATQLPDLHTVPQKRGRGDSETACSTASGAEEDFPAAKRIKEENGDEKPELIVVESA